MARPRKIVVHTENRLFERADTCVMGRGTYQSGGVQTLIEGLCRLVGESIRVRPPRR